jgi:plasmid stability protein
MTDIKQILPKLRRPRLLVRAAKHGLREYDRKRDLRRIAGTGPVNNSDAMVAHLADQESQIEANRKSGCATYSIARHIEILVALMAEYNLLPRGPRTS